jgi:hypothetical protein
MQQLDVCVPPQHLINTMFGIYTARGHEELSKVTTATALLQCVLVLCVCYNCN